jgi:UDP-glucose 4-epimerase
MELNDIKTTHRPVALGVGWLGDIKRMAQRIDRLKSIGFKPRL